MICVVELPICRFSRFNPPISCGFEVLLLQQAAGRGALVSRRVKWIDYLLFLVVFSCFLGSCGGFTLW